MSEINMSQKRALVKRNVLYLAASQNPTLAESYERYVETAPDSWIEETYAKITNPQSTPAAGQV